MPVVSVADVLADNRKLKETVASLRLDAAKLEKRFARVYLTLDFESSRELLVGRDFDGMLRDEMARLFRTSQRQVRAAIPYVTEGGYRDFTAMLELALGGHAGVRLIFRNPESASDEAVRERFHRDYLRHVVSGRIAARYLGSQGRSGLHAKVVIRDEEEALVSSANWTGFALTENSEVGLGTCSIRATTQLSKWFDRTFEVAQAWEGLSRFALDDD